MQGKSYSRIDGSQAVGRQAVSGHEACGRIVSLMPRLGASWTEDQRIAHLRDLIAAKAYRPNLDRMVELFMIRTVP